MTRVRNEQEYNEKRNQIISHAVALLDEVGFEKFSINKVIQNAGMTKGAFFHYFSTKKELLASIMELIYVPMMEAIKEVASDASLTPTQKIIALFSAAAQQKNTGDHVFQQTVLLLQKDENLAMRNEMQTFYLKECLPIYEKVMVQGNTTGEFDIVNPKGSVFIYLNTIVAINNEMGIVLYKKKVDPVGYEVLKSRIMAFELYSKELFGLENDINFYDAKLLDIKMK
ncbi:MAG: TetR/AcrR family transcriptional regulator [Clostridia bacterium]|nr:TetR/AcrR family transcriptional regulator [Clostridia bacterium]